MPYAPGQSGNQEGKRPGTRNRMTVLSEKAMHASPGTPDLAIS
jgi:hypothetical protein